MARKTILSANQLKLLDLISKDKKLDKAGRVAGVFYKRGGEIEEGDI